MELSLGFFDLFMNADIVVKLVMIILIGMSVLSWSIVIEKILELNSADKRAAALAQQFKQDRTFSFLSHAPNSPMKHIFSLVAASSHNGNINSQQESRIIKLLEKEVDGLGRRLGMLSTVSSAAPFIGLFGTVWGIMHSFQGIASSENTSLNAVAPGIAEALFATAVGLVVAIPAWMAFNLLNQKIERIYNQWTGYVISALHTLSS